MFISENLIQRIFQDGCLQLCPSSINHSDLFLLSLDWHLVFFLSNELIFCVLLFNLNLIHVKIKFVGNKL